MNGWTGGQYSVLRVVTGLALLTRLATLLAVADFGTTVVLAVVAGRVLCVPFVLGVGDRLAALGLVGVGLVLVREGALAADASALLVGAVLLVHAALPRAPLGSLAARRRVDPDGGWSMPRVVYRGAWLALAVGHALAGQQAVVGPDGSLPDRLASPIGWAMLLLALALAPVLLLPRLRPWLWLALAAAQVLALTPLVPWEPSLGAVLVLGPTFDPAWVRARPRPLEPGQVTVFYDGHCGFCHATVRWLLAEDRQARLRFAPIESDDFRASVPEAVRRTLPDSVVVRLEDGRVLARTDGLIALGARLGGLWRVTGLGLSLVPRAVRDLVYDGFARVRHRLFVRPAEACPIVPEHLRSRIG